ncbi:MAG TPA: PilC/PilY family type IV pilus protein, partial [Noviherbaspirillum sp.]
WDAKTGVFHSNPEDPADKNSATVNSGVLSYLNKFGRSGQYKTYDPVGELYYEGLRYLQGKQPSPEATADMTAAMQDGFPVLQKWQDPITAACQRNYILAIADVNTHWDRYIPGNVRTTHGGGNDAFDAARASEKAAASTPALDVKTWTGAVGKLEADASGIYANPKPNAKLANLESADTGSGGHGTYYMAGLAYWANTQDIRLDKPVRVKTFAIDVDEGGDGKIDGNQRGLPPRESQLYLAAKYGGFTDRNGDGNPFITLDADGKTVVKGSNAEWDNGGGVPANYFLAAQPQEMIAAIRGVFANIGSSSGTMSGVAISSSRLGAGGASVYQPGFDPFRWSGSLRKLAIAPGLDSAIHISTNAQWDAGEILTGGKGKKGKPAPAERKIYTSVIEQGVTKTIPFLWDELSSAQQAALDTAPAAATQDGLGRDRLDYLRGERGREIGQPNGVLRKRERILGDIVNSNPLYVGAPGMRAFGPGYAAFLEEHRQRRAAVYVGANDGMLHAFDAADGNELFAYIPSALIANLPALADPDYMHRPYVDGGLSAGEALVHGKWKSVLAGSFGGGAQGLFALDITDPASFENGAGALFEFTDADDADMGNLLGAPAVAKFRVKTDKGVPEYRYFVVAASGLNNYVDDGESRFNKDAAAALFLLALDKPASEAWKLGSNYYKLRLPAPNASLQNGLAQPALVVGPDGAVRYAYLGDLQGNLWRLDFRDDAPWSKATGNAKPVFIAQHGKDTRQPITTQPRVAFAPGGGYLVLFGTGKFVEDADAASGNFAIQTFYAVHDNLRSQSTLTRTHLAPRTATAVDDGFTISGEVFQYGAGGSSGWYFDFPDSAKTGERLVTNAAILNGSVFFNSLVPGADPCVAGGGRQYEFSILTGVPQVKVTGRPSTVGLLGTPVLFETEIEVGQRNAVGARVVKRRHGRVAFGTDGATFDGGSQTRLRAGRFSWREILNWQELRDAWTKK